MNCKYMKKSVFILILIILSLNACTTSKDVSQQFIDDPITRVDEEKLLNKAKTIDEYYDYPMIILLEKIIYRLKPNGQMILEVHQITKMLKDHKGALGNSFIYFREGYENISKVEAYTITKDNQKIDATEITTRSPFNNHRVKLKLYKDIKVKSIALPKVEKGSILYLRYQMEMIYSDINGLMEGEFYLANRYPILKQKGVIIVPKGKPIYFKKHNTNITPTKHSTRTEDFYVIKKNKSPIIQNEPFQPSFQEISPKITFTTFNNWNELNKKIYPILSAGIRNEPQISELAKKLTSGITSKKKKIEILYNFVTDTRNITNAAIPFGMGGYVPNLSSEILKNKYSDARDKVILLINLLKAVDIPSNIALSNESYNLDPELPSLKTLNRILIAIPMKNYYQFLDPHSAIVRYGFLPGANYGKYAVILSSDKPIIKKIPTVTSQDNSITYNSSSQLSPDGELHYKTSFIPKGTYEINERANMIKILLKNRFQNLHENYKQVHEVSKDIKLLDFNSSDPFDINKPFQYDVTFKISDYTTNKDSIVIIQPELHQKKLFSFSKHRFTDLDFTLPFKVISKHKIKIPNNWKAHSIPESINISAPHWTYTRNITISNHIITYYRLLEIKVSTIQKKDYTTFKTFIDKVIKYDKQTIHLKK